MLKSAYLRVYLPDDETSVAVRRLPESVAGQASFRFQSYGLVSESLTDDALIIEHSGNRFVCPRYAVLRVLESVLAFRNAYLDMGGDFLVPEEAARRAASELQRYLDREPEARSHILTSPWHVPLRWFLAFDPGEKQLVGPDPVRVVYRTDQTLATERLDRVVDALHRAGMEDLVVNEVDQVREWLSGFPPTCLVELDYGEVATMFRPADLISDETCADLWVSVTALEAGDWEEAVEQYGRAAGRWADAAAVTYSN